MVIDQTYLDHQTAGDRRLQCELLALLDVQIAELHDALAPGEEPGGRDVAVLLHRVRGAAVAIGAVNLGVTLAMAEEQVGTSSFTVAARASVADALALTRTEVALLVAALDERGLAKPRESR